MADKKNGFILPLVVILIFSISALLIRLMTRATMLAPLERMALEREQAKQLAMMGITLVQAQLALPMKEEKEKQDFYKQLLSLLNHWQTFNLKEDVDGIEGKIDLYVSSENGKIPLNALWRFKEKKFVAPPQGVDVKKLLANVLFAGKGSQKEQPVTERLEAFLKKQEQPLEDLTQVWADKDFNALAVHWFPPREVEKEQESGAIYFGDFFTVAHDDTKLQPPFFSAAVQQMLGMKPVEDKEKYNEGIKKLAEGLKEKVTWQQQWDPLLGQLYGVTYAKLPEDAKKLFSDQVGASLISVVSYGNIGTITQKVFAFLAQTVDADGTVRYVIRKLYWL